MERRDLLRLLTTTAGISALHTLVPSDLAAFAAEVRRRSPSQSEWAEALTAHERATLIAAAERIIPATDTPGATDADVVSFIDHMLDGWYTTAEREQFLTGLRELDERARRLRRADFVDIPEPDQVAILTALDAESTRRRQSGAREPNDHWFDTLKYLTVFGYCTSEVAMRKTLGAWPKPTHYDGCAPVTTTGR